MTSEPVNGKKQEPVTFDACPVCKGKKRLGADHIQQLKDAGVLHKDSFKNGFMHQIPLLDQAHPPTILGPTIKVNVANLYFDACADCGTMYCTRFEIVEMPAQIQMQQRPSPPPPAGRFFPPLWRG
jgi:hypothetical protein